jgi:hypothetical protein
LLLADFWKLGMRPQDIVILLKILTTPDPGWHYRDLASQLFISISEISESLHRSHTAGLIDESNRKVHRQSLMEFKNICDLELDIGEPRKIIGIIGAGAFDPHDVRRL